MQLLEKNKLKKDPKKKGAAADKLKQIKKKRGMDIEEDNYKKPTYFDIKLL